MNSFRFERANASLPEYIHQRVALEDLYKTNFLTGTREKWRELYYGIAGLMSTFFGEKNLVHTLRSNAYNQWSYYEYYSYDWGDSYREAAPFFQISYVNSDKSMVAISQLQYLPATRTYTKEMGHINDEGVWVDTVQTPDVITFADRVGEYSGHLDVQRSSPRNNACPD